MQVNEKTNAGARDWSRHVGRTFCKACFLYFAQHGSFAGRERQPSGGAGNRRDGAVARGRQQDGRQQDGGNKADASDQEDEEETEEDEEDEEDGELAEDADDVDLDQDDPEGGEQAKKSKAPKSAASGGAGAAGGCAAGSKSKGSGVCYVPAHAAALLVFPCLVVHFCCCTRRFALATHMPHARRAHTRTKIHTYIHTPSHTPSQPPPPPHTHTCTRTHIYKCGWAHT